MQGSFGRLRIEDHMLREEIGDLSRLGGGPPLEREVMATIARASLLVAGADGRVSATERQALVERLLRFGAPPAIVERIRAWDPAGATLHDVLDPVVTRAAPLVLYSGIAVASADGIHAKELAALRACARELRLPPTLVDTLVQVVRVDAEVRDARHRLVAAPGPETRRAASELLTTGEAARAYVFGPPAGGPMPAEVAMRISKATLHIAAGDGELTEPELAWYLGLRKAIGMPDSAIEALLKFDAAGARFEDVVTADLRPYGRGILYSAVKTASQDGSHDRERALASRAAQRLGLDEGYVVAVENHVRIENATRDARHMILAAPTT